MMNGWISGEELIKVEKPWEGHQLIAQVRALSRLPPNAKLPRLPEDEQVLLESLALAEDPVKWLERTSGVTIARVMLWKALKDLAIYLQGAYRAWQSGIHLRLGKPPSLSEEVQESLHLLDNTRPTTISLEILKTVLKKLRPYYQDEAFRKYIENEEAFSLLSELLSLPREGDEIEYIVEEFSHIGSIETIRYLISQVIPPPASLWEPSMKVFHPNISSFADGYQVTLKEMAIGSHGFALTLQTKISEALFQLPKNITLMLVEWGGAAQIFDDQGYHYLVCHQLGEHVGHGRTHYMKLQLLCFPSISATATQITLAIDRMSFSGIGFQLKQKVQQHYPHYVLQSKGRLTWSVDVSQKDIWRPRPWKPLIGE
jgi:hypothetical protein